MSSSPDRQVLYRAADRPDLRTGVWTRLGDSAVLGDPVTEAALDGLAERTHSAARAQGYAVGWAEGRQEALVRMSEVEAAADQGLLATLGPADGVPLRAGGAVGALGQAAEGGLGDLVAEDCRVAEPGPHTGAQVGALDGAVEHLAAVRRRAHRRSRG